jgi:CRP-like cAMP-binding protein
MTRPSILASFASHPFLDKLPDWLLMDLAGGVQPFTATDGEFLGRLGQPADKFYLIQAGTVTLGTERRNREIVPIQTVKPGEVVGWSWLMPPHRWQFHCKASGTVRGLAFDAAWLRDRCEKNHELGYHVFKELIGVLASRLAATRLQLSGVATP